MPAITIPRIVLAGTQSGVGKTTLVTGLLAALRQNSQSVQAYKIGPDYIDPGFHAMASGRPSHNLDTWLMPESEMLRLFAHTSEDCQMAVVEGVMGLYDGGRQGISSTAAIAKALQAPVVLVIDAKAMGESAAAMALGYCLYDPEVQLAGVILNRLGSDNHRNMIAEALHRRKIPLLGSLRREEQLVMPERHLGLVPVGEMPMQERIDKLAAHISRQVDVKALVALARSAVPLQVPEVEIPAKTWQVRVAVAQDEAFSFYYPESLAVLQRLGAKLVPFSPLRDQALPAADGILLGGGFPEMFLQALAENTAILHALRRAHAQNMPIYAECGGLMYLCREVIDFEGQRYTMAGLVPAVTRMEKRLQTVGYVEAEALQDTVAAAEGEVLRGHEFHFSQMVVEDKHSFSWAFRLRKLRTGQEYPGGYVCGRLLASYLHTHFGGSGCQAERFLEQCWQFASEGRR